MESDPLDGRPVPLSLRRVAAALSVVFAVSAACLILAVGPIDLKDAIVCVVAAACAAALAGALPWLALWPVGLLLGLLRPELGSPSVLGRRDLIRYGKLLLVLAPFLGFAFWLDGLGPGFCRQPKEPLQLRLTLPKTRYHVGERLWFNLEAKNVGCRPIDIYDDFMLTDWPKFLHDSRPSQLWVEVRDSQGRDLEPEFFFGGFHGEFDPYDVDMSANRNYRAQYEENKPTLFGRYTHDPRIARDQSHYTLRPGASVRAAPTIKKGLRTLPDEEFSRRYWEGPLSLSQRGYLPVSQAAALQKIHERNLSVAPYKGGDDSALLGRWRLLKENVFRKAGTYTVQGVYKGYSSSSKSEALRIEVIP